MAKAVASWKQGVQGVRGGPPGAGFTEAAMVCGGFTERRNDEAERGSRAMNASESEQQEDGSRAGGEIVFLFIFAGEGGQRRLCAIPAPWLALTSERGGTSRRGQCSPAAPIARSKSVQSSRGGRRGQPRSNRLGCRVRFRKGEALMRRWPRAAPRESCPTGEAVDGERGRHDAQRTKPASRRRRARKGGLARRPPPTTRSASPGADEREKQAGGGSSRALSAALGGTRRAEARPKAKQDHFGPPSWASS